MGWFLYDRDLRHERSNISGIVNIFYETFPTNNYSVSMNNIFQKIFQYFGWLGRKLIIHHSQIYLFLFILWFFEYAYWLIALKDCIM